MIATTGGGSYSKNVLRDRVGNPGKLRWRGVLGTFEDTLG